jgi:HAD superfamily hydrolase (TIGR01484 family)
MAVRLIATDLDGTVLRTDATVSDRTRAALAGAEQAGIVVVLVSGRPPRHLAPIAEELGHTGVAICANGALVYDLHTERVVAEHVLEPVVAAKVVKAVRDALPDIAFAVDSGTALGREPGYRSRFPPPPDTVVAQVEELVTSPVAKILARHDGLDVDELHARVRALLADLGDIAEVTFSGIDGLL